MHDSLCKDNECVHYNNSLTHDQEIDEIHTTRRSQLAHAGVAGIGWGCQMFARLGMRGVCNIYVDVRTRGRGLCVLEVEHKFLCWIQEFWNRNTSITHFGNPVCAK